MDFSAACLDGMLGAGLNSSSNNGNGNGHRLCRSASEMDLEQTSRDHDWRSSSSASIKMARTDSFPTLMRSSSVISDASAARMETNNNSSAASDLLESAEAAMLMRSDSVVSPYRSCLPFYHHQQQQPGGYQYANNSNKPSGLPLSMGRVETMNINAGMHHTILAGTRSPFTPSQWQELEQQALIFKYMMVGVPVPPDLLIPLRRTTNIFSSLPVAGSTLRSNLGWSSFHLGFAANNADPEPGRCRRTDGKKWRCSRDAVPDQKYCERHMNRGRHRSRKPVEGQTPHHHHSATAQSSSTSGATNNSSSASSLAAAAAGSAVTATNTTTTTTSVTASSTSSQTNLLRSSISSHQQQQIGTKLSVFPASMSAGHGGVASPAASVSPFQITLNVDRYQLNGMKGDIDGPMFESSSQSINGLSMLSSVNNAWGSRNMVPAKTTNNDMMSYETRTLIDDGGQNFGLLNQNQMSSLLSMTQNQSNNSQVLQGFGAGNEEEQQQRGIRHNFFDDWPRTSRDRSTTMSWTEMERMRSSTSSSATKLSISIPSEFDSPGSPRCEKFMLSPLKLSMSRDADPLGIDPTTQMGLGMGMGMAMGLANQTSEQCRQKQTSWNPITWESPVGGPLAEVLNSTKDCNVKNSALNLMTDGWDCSPRGGDSSRMASPTGVLQKTFGSLSDSSTGSSPRAISVAKAAHDSAGLCENLRTVTFVTGASAPISTT